MMKRSRFLLISRFLHFSNDEVISSSPDRLHKIRELVDGFRVIWKFNYTAISTSPYLSVDETIIPFKGRLIIKQYMANKPHRFGIKAFSVCDSKTGYVINWKIYAGKENGKTTSSKDVVLNLLEDFQNKGYRVFTDIFFTSIELMEILQSQGISLTGTIRSTRKYLPKIDKSKLNGQAIYKRCKTMLLTGWKDKQNVFLVSNLYGRKEVIKEKKNQRRENSRI